MATILNVPAAAPILKQKPPAPKKRRAKKTGKRR